MKKMTIWDVIDNKVVPNDLIEHYRKSNPSAGNFSEEEIKTKIVKGMIYNVSFIETVLEMEIQNFSKINTKEDTEIAKESLYSYANKHIGLLNQKFQKRLELLCGTEIDRKEFSDKLEKDIYKTLNKHHETIQVINQSREVKRNLFDKNPEARLLEYSEDLYKLEHDPGHLISAPKRVKKMMADFAKGSINFLQLRTQHLNYQPTPQKNTTGNKKMPAVKKKIKSEKFEDMFIPPYDEHVPEFIQALKDCKLVTTERETWVGHNGMARMFYEHLVLRDVIYGAKEIPKTKAASLFGERFINLGRHFLGAKESNATISEDKSTTLKDELDYLIRDIKENRK